MFWHIVYWLVLCLIPWSSETTLWGVWSSLTCQCWSQQFTVSLSSGWWCSSGGSCTERTYWDSSETVGGRSQRQPPEQGWGYWLSKATYFFLRASLHMACVQVQVLCGWCRAGSQGLSDCLTNTSTTTDSFPGIHISVNGPGSITARV